MDDDTASIRRLRLLRVLLTAHRPLSRRDLARRFGRSCRTLGRDAEVIGLVVPLIVEHRGRQQFYSLAPDALGTRSARIPEGPRNRSDQDTRPDDGRDDLVH